MKTTGDKLFYAVMFMIIGWFVGYLHHYEATKDILTTRHEALVMKRVAESEMRQYAALVRYQEDIITVHAAIEADDVLLQGEKHVEFSELCRQVWRERYKHNNKPNMKVTR